MDSERLLKNSNFFNAADVAIAHEMDFHGFEKSLFQNILFQESILLHEAYFFNSEYLLRHAYRYGEGTRSLFGEAAKKGLVIPAISDASNKNMKQLYEFLVEKYGKNNNNFRMDLLKDARFKSYLRNIQDGWKKRGNVQHWPDTFHEGKPESFGQGFERLVHDFFYNKEMPINENEDPNSDTIHMRRRVWTNSEPWRNECFENAIKESKKYGIDAGLRRGNLFTEIAKSFNVEDPEKGVLLDYVLGFVKDEETALCLKIYWSWLNQCHHMNFGNKVNKTVNFPYYRSDSDFLADNKFIHDKTKNENYESVEFNLELPTIEALKNTAPQKLIKLRTSTEALEYFDCLKEFEESNSDSDSDRRHLENQLKNYTQGICNLVPKSQLCKSKSSILKSGGDVLSLAGVVGAMSSCFINELVNPYAVVVGSAGLVFTLMDNHKKQTLPKKRRNFKFEISIKK